MERIWDALSCYGKARNRYEMPGKSEGRRRFERPWKGTATTRDAMERHSSDHLSNGIDQSSCGLVECRFAFQRNGDARMRNAPYG